MGGKATGNSQRFTLHMTNLVFFPTSHMIPWAMSREIPEHRHTGNSWSLPSKS